MTRQQINTAETAVSQLTISTWVYISSDAVKAQRDRSVDGTLEPHFASAGIRRRIPIIEFGRSIEPRVGIRIPMSFYWEGYLGWFWWGATAGVPYFPDYLCGFMIGGEGTSRDGWWDFTGGRAYPSVDPTTEWQNALEIIGGVSASGAGTAFYYMPPGRNIFPITPAVLYTGFGDTGMLQNNVKNDGLLGPWFALYPGGDFDGKFALPLTWTFAGELRVGEVFNSDKIAVLPGDVCKETHLINSEIFFTNFWASPLNNTIQPTPTPTMGAKPNIRVDTGMGDGKYFAFGDIVVVFPEIKGAIYGEPAIPSALYYDGNIHFLLTGPWPKENTTVDQEIVPLLNFSASGFVLDSWNHIFFTVDMTTMELTGGQDDKALMQWVETLKGPELERAPLVLPDMTTPPQCAMFINRKRKTVSISPKLTVYPVKDGHWKDQKTFPMQMGEIGFPIISDEIGRYKVTGPNQKIDYAFTHIYLGKYIEPTIKNVSKFVWESKRKEYNYCVPPPDKKAAVKEFGMPDVWLYRDKEGGVQWKNQGKGGKFSNAGTPPKDHRPGPGQPTRKKPTT